MTMNSKGNNFSKNKKKFSNKRSSFFLWTLFLLFFSALPVLLSGCSKKPVFPKSSIKKIRVDAVKASYKTVRMYLKSPGNVTSLNNTAISAHIVGYVKYETVHLGQIVKKGQLLLRLSAPEIKSKYFAAKAGFLNAEKTYKRIARLYKENSVSRQMYDNTLMQYRVAKADLNAASSYLNYKNIYSPIDGVITKKNVSLGDLAAPGQMLFMIQSVKNLEFKTAVNVKYYVIIKKLRYVKLVFSSNGKPVNGEIISVVRSANPYSHSIIIRIKIIGAMRNDILPGMYGISEFKIGKEKAIIIPKKAVLKRLGVDGVYITGKGGEVMFQPVKEGPVYKNKFIVILNGLKPGVIVITSDINKISNGSHVTPVFPGRRL